jgi:hypothetical protein
VLETASEISIENNKTKSEDFIDSEYNKLIEVAKSRGYFIFKNHSFHIRLMDAKYSYPMHDLYKYQDEWYLSAFSKRKGDNRKFYRCDGFKGLLKYLEDNL